MRTGPLVVAITALVTFVQPSASFAETREAYLERLRAICEIECLQPRQFQRAARKRKLSDHSDMAVIMDVVTVRITGDRVTLYDNVAPTSPSEGDGALTWRRHEDVHPNVIAIELNWQTVFDLLKIGSDSQGASGRSLEQSQADGDIVVDGVRPPKIKRPSVAKLSALVRNRRIVVRGRLRLEVRIVGARRDYRRKQAILEVASADDIVLLPRYDKDGQPIYGGEFELEDAGKN